jgi:hypothetical protein
MLVERIVIEKVTSITTIILREVNYEDDQITDGGIVYKQILINAKLQIVKRGQKTELAGSSPFRRRRSAVDCSAIGEEEQEKEVSGETRGR